MRISGGQFKGRRVASRKVLSPKTGQQLRPTSSKVREALFDILRSSITDSAFVDLYAGTGTVGLEALSRGAAVVCLVEEDIKRFRAIADCIRVLGVSDRAHAINDKARNFIRKSFLSGDSFDIIFADPPYASGDISEFLSDLDEYQVVKDGGCVIIEHSSKLSFSEDTRTLMHIKDYRYGDTMLTLFRRAQ